MSFKQAECKSCPNWKPNQFANMSCSLGTGECQLRGITTSPSSNCKYHPDYYHGMLEVSEFNYRRRKTKVLGVYDYAQAVELSTRLLAENSQIQIKMEIVDHEQNRGT